MLVWATFSSPPGGKGGLTHHANAYICIENITKPTAKFKQVLLEGVLSVKHVWPINPGHANHP